MGRDCGSLGMSPPSPCAADHWDTENDSTGMSDKCNLFLVLARCTSALVPGERRGREPGEGSGPSWQRRAVSALGWWVWCGSLFAHSRATAAARG